MRTLTSEITGAADISGVSTHLAEPSRSWFGPPLRTLRQPAFDAACAALMRLVEADYAPTLIVGIRTGGLIVAEAMAHARSDALPVLPLTSRRTSTGRKMRLPGLRTSIANLPRPLADLTRRLEHQWVTTRRVHRDQQQKIDRTEADAIAAWLRTSPQRGRILVTDDAVDSGVTLATVLQTLQDIDHPGMELRAAVITQTLPNPRVVPDYVLWRGTLCRFPWSLDA